VIPHNRLEEEHHDDRDRGDQALLFLLENLAQGSPDLKRELTRTFINAPLPAQVDGVCGSRVRRPLG
jgi:hypothetical protein